ARAGWALGERAGRIRRAESVWHERELGLADDDGRTAAGNRLRHDALPRWTRSVHAGASRIRTVDVRRGSQTVANERRRLGRLHAVLAHEQRGLVGAAVLGER